MCTQLAESNWWTLNGIYTCLWLIDLLVANLLKSVSGPAWYLLVQSMPVMNTYQGSSSRKLQRPPLFTRSKVTERHCDQIGGCGFPLCVIIYDRADQRGKRCHDFWTNCFSRTPRIVNLISIETILLISCWIAEANARAVTVVTDRQTTVITPTAYVQKVN